MNPALNELQIRRFSLLCQLAAGFLCCFLFEACSQYQHPDLQPRQLGWQPDRDLAPYLSTDSMIASLEHVNGTRRKLDSLLEWTDLLNYRNKDAALEDANEAWRLAAEKGYRLSQALAMYYRALLKSRMQIYGEGIEDALGDGKISRTLLRAGDDPAWKVRINGLLGYLYYRQREFDKTLLDSARIYSVLALEETEGIQLPEKEIAYLRAQLYQDQANTYRSTDRAQAEDLFRKSIGAAERSGNQALLAAVWRTAGRFYLDKGELARADSALLLSKSFAQASQDTNNLIYTYQELAALFHAHFLTEKNAEEKYRSYEQSMNYLRLCRSIQKEENLFFTYAQMGYNLHDKFYFEQGGDPPTTYAAEGDSAIYYYRLALEEAKKEGVLRLVKNMVLHITWVCDNKQDLTNEDCSALWGARDYKDFLNESYSILVDTMRNELEASNTRIRNFEQMQLAATNKRRVSRNWLISALALLFAGLIFLILLQIQQKKRLQARMEALRAQINPHFISNSLNAIESLVNLDQREAASRYLIHFSRLSRKILNSSRDSLTSLEEELQTLKHFLELEQLRFRDKLTYEIDLAAGIVPALIEVPALMLQPYAENAIWHGIKPKPEPGKLKIFVERQGKDLVCIVEDDGIGREKAAELKQKSVLQPHRSQGMKINEERLDIIGKTKGAKVQIIDLFDTAGKPVGTRVLIRLPFKLRHKEK